MDKLISLDEAASRVGSGSTLALGGMTLYRRPMAFVRTLVHRHTQGYGPENLTLVAFTAGMESDWLIGAGLVSTVRTCYFGLEIFGLAPMFTYFASCGEIDIMEETEASLAFGLRAQMAGVGFMPGRAWIGTDLPKLRPDVCKVIDPYSGEELMAFPAIHPNIAVIHALCADPDGNALIGDNKAVDEELAVASDYVIVTTEQVVPELTKADLAAPVVHAVVHTPGGAKPTSCHPLYPMDGEAILAYSEQVSDRESFVRYIASQIPGYPSS